MQQSPISLLDDVFARMQMAARETHASPTAAQAEAGNYRKGRVTLHGLSMAFENAHGSVRSGTSADGKAWVNRMAAIYGEFVGTRGADGDPVDVFVGPFPESTRVWVINQGWPDGGFDEHKVMLGFTTEAMARDAYTGSFDRGWTGLQSIVQITLEQLKWWLVHGAHKRPLSLDQLPFDGAPSMNKTLWDSNAQPLTPMHKLMYELRSEDADGLLLDAVSLTELMADPDVEKVSQLDALVVPVARMTQRMDILQRVMDLAGEGVKPTGYTISDPIRARGVMQVAVLFAMSDGQAVTVWFHNPDSTPAKITPMDELISWKWMLNKKDITIVVAPERGRELMPKEVARRIMRLVQKNSTAFLKANVKLAERMAALASVDTEIEQLETRLGEVRHDIEVAHQRLADKAAAPKVAIDVTSPDGYRLILAGDETLARERQDELDAMFQERYVAVRNALRELGWSGPTYGTLSKDGATMAPEIEHVGAGKNVVGIVYGVKLAGDDAVEMANQVRDTLEQSPAELAATVDALLPAAAGEQEGETSAAEAAEWDAAKRHAEILEAQLVAEAEGLVHHSMQVALDDFRAFVIAAQGSPDGFDSPGQVREIADNKAKNARHYIAEAKAAAEVRAAEAGAEVVAAAVDAARRGAGGIARILTSKFFTFEMDGDDGLVLTDELRAKVEAVLGEPLVEHVFPGLEGEVALVPASSVADKSDEMTDERAREMGRAAAQAGDPRMTPVDFPKEHARAWLEAWEAEKTLAAVAAVDAAYQFADATPAFKRLVANSVEDDGYSAFKSAMTIDLAVKAAGGSVAWGVSAVGKLDGVAEAAKPYLPEGAVLDFAGDVSAAIAQLQIALDVVTTNEPINRAEGKVDQADLERNNAEQFRTAIDVLSATEMLDGAATDDDDFDAEAEFDALPVDDPDETVLDGDFPGHPFRGNQYRKASAESGTAVKASMRAKHHETKGNKKEAKKAHLSAALTHKAAAMHAKGAAKSYHRKMAKFHGSRSGAQLDAVLDDSTGVNDPVVEAMAGYAFGRISAGGAVIGRAVIAGGDGKAMVYQGAEGAERVKRIDDDYPFYFSQDDEELEAMVAGLFSQVKRVGDAPVAAAPIDPRIGLVSAVAAELELLGWFKSPVRQGFSLMSPRGTNEVVIEPDADHETAIETRGASVMVDLESNPADVAMRIEMEDFAGEAGFGTDVDFERVNDEESPFNGKTVAFARANEVLELAVQRAGAVMVWGDFNASLNMKELFDFASDTGVSAQIGTKDGVVLARAAISDAGMVRLYRGASGDDLLVATDKEKVLRDTLLEQIASLPAAEPAPPAVEVEPQPSEEEVTPAPEVTPAVAEVSPELAADRAYLQSLIDGTGDVLAADTGPKLEAIYAKHEANADMMALFEKAATAYGDAVIAQAKQALVAA